jgi:copper chaperone
MKFSVTDMSCAHCAGRITAAVKQVDVSAQVNVDLDRKQVAVVSAVSTEAVAAAITEAGYTPLLQDQL